MLTKVFQSIDRLGRAGGDLAANDATVATVFRMNSGLRRPVVVLGLYRPGGGIVYVSFAITSKRFERGQRRCVRARVDVPDKQGPLVLYGPGETGREPRMNGRPQP